MKKGYARVSTQDQNLDMQLNALKEAKCELIYQEKQSGVKNRIELRKLLNSLIKGDIVIVYKLDRIGRSVREVINIIHEINEKGCELISLSDKMDSTTPQGRLMLNILLSFAQFERELIIQRVNDGLKAAKERGVKLGQPIKYDKQVVKTIRTMLKQHHKPSYIRDKLKIPKSTYYKLLAG